MSDERVPIPWVTRGTAEGLGVVRSAKNNHRIAFDLHMDDAFLIAAAPELLEALRHHFDQDIPFSERQALARDAIAKATAQ